MEAVTAIQSAQSSTPPAAPAEKARLETSTDYETFLTLLTAQIRNQDPLEPLDSTQFVAQLATFSAVEQQIQSNAKLDGILAALGGGGATRDLADWIGKDVRAAAPAAFEGAPVEIFARPVSGADAAHLVVRNAASEIVAGQTVDPTAEIVSWSGLTELGTAPSGLYSFSIESFKEGKFLEARDGEVFAAVQEARDERGDIILILDGGVRVAAETVEAVRATTSV